MEKRLNGILGWLFEDHGYRVITAISLGMVLGICVLIASCKEETARTESTETTEEAGTTANSTENETETEPEPEDMTLSTEESGLTSLEDANTEELDIEIPEDVFNDVKTCIRKTMAENGYEAYTISEGTYDDITNMYYYDVTFDEIPYYIYYQNEVAVALPADTTEEEDITESTEAAGYDESQIVSVPVTFMTDLNKREFLTAQISLHGESTGYVALARWTNEVFDGITVEMLPDTYDVYVARYLDEDGNNITGEYNTYLAAGTVTVAEDGTLTDQYGEPVESVECICKPLEGE